MYYAWQQWPKTSKGFKTLAYNIIHGNGKQKSDKIIQFQLSYGRSHEPIEIKHFESYIKQLNHVVLLLTQKTLFQEQHQIVKQFLMKNLVSLKLNAVKNIAVQVQRTYVLFLKNFYSVFGGVTEKIHINEKHTYYDQIQMQLALTTQA